MHQSYLITAIAMLPSRVIQTFQKGDRLDQLHSHPASVIRLPFRKLPTALPSKSQFFAIMPVAASTLPSVHHHWDDPTPTNAATRGMPAMPPHDAMDAIRLVA